MCLVFESLPYPQAQARSTTQVNVNGTGCGAYSRILRHSSVPFGHFDKVFIGVSGIAFDVDEMGAEEGEGNGELMVGKPCAMGLRLSGVWKWYTE